MSQLDWEVATFYVSEDSSGVLYFNLSTKDEAEYLARCYIAEHGMTDARVKIDRKASTVLIIVP
jgi:hypothetical protein